MRWWVALIFLAGCTLGPDYCPPDVCVPSEYTQVEESESIDIAQWWHQFEDPVLDELVEDLMCGNLDLQIAYHRIEEIRNLYKIRRGNLYPQIQGNMVALRSRRSENLSADVIETTGTPVDIFPGDFSGPLISDFFQTGFDASWEIDFFGKNRRIEEAAFALYEREQEETLALQISLLSELATRYVDVRALQTRIQTLKEQITFSEELLDLALSRYEAGIASYLDVSRARSQLKSRQSELPPLIEDLNVTIHAIAVLLGCPPEGFGSRFDDETGVPIAKGRVPAGLPSELLCRRPDIRAADRELHNRTARVGVAIANIFPSFSLTGSFGVQSNLIDKLFIWPSRFWVVGPSMVWDLFTGGKRIGQIRVEEERQKQAILNYERVIYFAFSEVEDRLVGYYEEEKRQEALEGEVVANSELRDLLLEQYDSGLISLDDVLRAQDTLFISLQEMTGSTGTLMNQLIGLYKALGGGWTCCDLP